MHSFKTCLRVSLVLLVALAIDLEILPEWSAAATEMHTFEFTTDSSWEGNNVVAVSSSTWYHLPGATWIWSSPCDGGQAATFSKSFFLREGSIMDSYVHVTGDDFVVGDVVSE